MKTIFITALLSLFLIPSALAEYRIYTDKEEFENAKGAICESAHDGCNTYFMTDGKVMGGTRMYCENHKVEWTCKKYKENSISTMSIATTSFLDEVNTTPAPEDKLSVNDRNFYNSIKETKLEEKYQERVNKVLAKYSARLEKLPENKRKNINEKSVKFLEKKISQILMQYPQDIALTEKINNLYLMLTLLKFEMKLLD